MIKFNFKLYNKINGKYHRYVAGLIFIIFIFSAVLTLLAIRQPLKIEEKIIKNNIEEKNSYDYKALVKPSTLYPSGGIIIPDKVIFNSLTEDFIVEIKTDINAENPVRVEATKEVTYKLVAEKMWEREFLIKQPIKYNSEGTSHNVLNEEVHININDINSYLTKIEEETLVRPNYLLTIKSSVTGNVYDEKNNVIYEIDNILEIPFDLSGQYISYAGETDEREFAKTKAIEEINVIPQYFNLWGMNLSVVGSRIGFGVAAIISLLLLIIFIIEKIHNKTETLTEINIIDKKNKGNIVTITDKIDMNSMPQVAVKSFKDLLKIAEEKDESILKYFDNSLGIVYYYITSSSFIYIFKCINGIKGSEQVQDA